MEIYSPPVMATVSISNCLVTNYYLMYLSQEWRSSAPVMASVYISNHLVTNYYLLCHRNEDLQPPSWPLSTSPTIWSLIIILFVTGMEICSPPSWPMPQSPTIWSRSTRRAEAEARESEIPNSPAAAVISKTVKKTMVKWQSLKKYGKEEKKES